ncbi:hypothetical protein BT96DRAFT_877618 [Gymnopus androsaceus JB14]|uniref:F-box domain-containing protein n=1 Tax=Gymnopus androsaceus JB14 TaxID=1447944 RepID=A0A6A4I5R9_9AGAR|nr:hypothetical protein BT96DRAFT_877618 [Gymnopus androsaceus JB14]
MAPPLTANIQLRTNVDFSDARRRLRLEYGPASPFESEISKTLMDVDNDLKDCDTELNRIQSEINRLQARVVFLHNQHRRLEKYKTCLFSLRAPIRKLPNEIVLRIFDHTCDTNELTSRRLQTMPALLLSHVCLRWKELASAYPELWCRICIRMDRLPSFTILDFYLHSSQQFPLILEFPGKVELLKPHHLTLCATFGARSNQWKSLEVQSPPVFQTLIANSAHFSMLEKLSLEYWFDSSMDCFQNASNLQSLTVWIDLEIFPSSNFPWTQLTQLVIHHCNPRLDVLFGICPNLKDLTFDLATIGRNTGCEPTVTAQMVERLELILPARIMYGREPDESLLDVIFASITCPSLKSLLIEVDNGYKESWNKDELNSFITRSSFHLTTLSIKFIPLSDLDLIDLLCHLPSLLHLTIRESKTSSSQKSYNIGSHASFAWFPLYSLHRNLFSTCSKITEPGAW